MTTLVRSSHSLINALSPFFVEKSPFLVEKVANFHQNWLKAMNISYFAQILSPECNFKTPELQRTIVSLLE